MELFGIVMAGGRGRRFWPLSRENSPKQFLKLTGDNTMIQNTIDRIMPIIKKENIFVILSKGQGKPAREILPDFPSSNIVVEPMGKDTAPCVGLGAVLSHHRNKDGVQIVLPADHLILDEEKFRETLLLGARVADETGTIVTIGISPSRPETGYGYIQYEREAMLPYPSSVHKVKTFAEKPNLDTAERFLKSGDFIWNSGIFIWKVSTILQEFEHSLPETYEGLMEIEKHLNDDNISTVIKKVYSQIKSISVDYGIMERARNVCVIKGDFGWSDMGSWEEIYRLGEKDKKGNVLHGNAVLHHSNNNLIYGDKRLIATVGLKNFVVVDTKDVILICHRNHTQDVKAVVESLKKDNKKHL